MTLNYHKMRSGHPPVDDSGHRGRPGGLAGGAWVLRSQRRLGRARAGGVALEGDLEGQVDDEATRVLGGESIYLDVEDGAGVVSLDITGLLYRAQVQGTTCSRS